MSGFPPIKYLKVSIYKQLCRVVYESNVSDSFTQYWEMISPQMHFLIYVIMHNFNEIWVILSYIYFQFELNNQISILLDS